MNSPSFFEWADNSVLSLTPELLLTHLEEEFRTRRDWHRLFDVTCLRSKWQLQLPLTRPSSFEDVTPETKPEFEKVYVNAARETGLALAREQRWREAWIYFHAIRDFQPLREILQQWTPPPGPELSETEYQQLEEALDVAVMKRVHPVLGLEWMLRHHGLCSTLTSAEQLFAELPPAERARVASLFAKHLHADLLLSLERDVLTRDPQAPPSNSVAGWIDGRPQLFEVNNYHVDVSHLHAVVRFARALTPEDAALPLSIELAEYGSHLSKMLRYASEPPFEDFYTAHRYFLMVLEGHGRDQGLRYFQDKLAQAQDPSARTLIQLALIELYMRLHRYEEAIPYAEAQLDSQTEDFSGPFMDLCREAGRWDLLEKIARDRSDPLMFSISRLSPLLNHKTPS